MSLLFNHRFHHTLWTVSSFPSIPSNMPWRDISWCVWVFSIVFVFHSITIEWTKLLLMKALVLFNLMGKTWYLQCSACISIDIGHIYICLMAIYSSVNSLFISFPHFSIGLLFIYLQNFSICVLCINPLDHFRSNTIFCGQSFVLFFFFSNDIISFVEVENFCVDKSFL